MSAISYFIAILALSLLSSALLISWQQRALGPLLEASCPGSGAHYWHHTLAALQLLIPMLLVLCFASHQSGDLVNELRMAIVWLLLGHLLAILAIARMVWKRLVPPQALPEL